MGYEIRSIRAAALLGFLLMACTDTPADECDVDWRDDKGMDGFFSPIPLPRLDEILPDACVEPVITPAASGIWMVNGENLVDLGIFHIHDGIEHIGLGEACETPTESGRCGEAKAHEAHVPLGTAVCRDDVLAGGFPDTDEGRSARADALLGCARAVVGYAVCLDGTATHSDLGELWPKMQGTRCYNFGGPTGGHAGHAGMVQWIHLRDLCESLTADPTLITRAWETGKVQVGVTAPVELSGQEGDVPLCGTVAQTVCEGCGGRHERCCGPEDLPMTVDESCHADDSLACVEGRCWPSAPHWPANDCTPNFDHPPASDEPPS